MEVPKLLEEGQENPVADIADFKTSKIIFFFLLYWFQTLHKEELAISCSWGKLMAVPVSSLKK